MATGDSSRLTRRGFIKAGAAFTILASASAKAYAANGKLEIGVVGTGGRGSWLGNLFQVNTDTKVVAVHDYFRDRVDAAGERLGVEPARRHVGLDGYKELIGSSLDGVAIISPPYFHPEQAVAALNAGKHVYLAKPIAVDAAGCLAIVEAAKQAEGKLCTLVDFQTRKDPFYQEAARLVHEGKIGVPVCGQAYYQTNRLGMQAPPGTETARLRNWVFDKALSGDIIVEQNIHALDVANWLLRGHPVTAHGYGGRKARTDVGDCWDHFVVTYHYDNDVLLDFSSNQFAPGYEDICARIYGSDGTVDTHYGGAVKIGSRTGTWPGGETKNIYQDGAIVNMKEFHAAVTSDAPINNAQESANSTLTSILGRMAAYEGRTVTWDEMLAVTERLDPKLDLPADGPEWKPE